MTKAINRLRKTSDIVFGQMQKCEKGEIESEALGRFGYAGIAIAMLEKGAFDIERQQDAA